MRRQKTRVVFVTDLGRALITMGLKRKNLVLTPWLVRKLAVRIRV
jgi:hypothetical protein